MRLDTGQLKEELDQLQARLDKYERYIRWMADPDCPLPGTVKTLVGGNGWDIANALEACKFAAQQLLKENLSS